MPSAPTTSEQNAPPFRLTDTDRRILAQTDDEFVCYNWDDLRKIIGLSLLSYLYQMITTDLETCCGQRRTTWAPSNANLLTKFAISTGQRMSRIDMALSQIIYAKSGCGGRLFQTLRPCAKTRSPSPMQGTIRSSGTTGPTA